MCLPKESKLSNIEVNLKKNEKKKELTVSASETASLLNSFTLEELRENAIGRALVDEQKALKMNHDEIVELLLPFAHGMTYNPPHMALHPFSPPSITLGEIRAAIPAHLFKRDVFRGLRHLVLDISLVAAIFYAGTFIENSGFHPAIRCILWALYWYLQSAHMTGIWVIAHECGHNAFSESQTLDNVLGWMLHSSLLVPFYSWKISHRNHHLSTGSSESDEVFTCDAHQYNSVNEAPPATGFFRIRLELLSFLFCGWPLYLWFNTSGPMKYPKNITSSHFDPRSPLFTRKDCLGVILSDVGLIIALYGFGLANVLTYYYAPYLGNVMYLLVITYLQHTDASMPHFRRSDWNWFKGALCTIDRSYGYIVDHTIHHITDTHVVHHLFCKVPFYNAQEVARYIPKLLGKYYAYDKTPIFAALYRSWDNCCYVEDSEKQKVLFYRRGI